MQYQKDILDAIRRILRALRESSRSAETELGLSGAQLLVLQFLKSGHPLSINELAERTQTHQSSVSAIVTKLVEAGLVKREASPQDGRRVEIDLTVSGMRLLKKKSMALAHERLFAGISELTPNHQKQLAELLVKVVHSAGFGDQPATLFFEDDPERSQ